MIYVKIFSKDNRLDLQDQVNEWIGSMKKSGDFFVIKDTQFSTASIQDSFRSVVYSVLIVYEVHLTEERK